MIGLAGAQDSRIDGTPLGRPGEGEGTVLPQLPRRTLLLFAVDLGRTPLTESLTAYGDPADPLLPMGELARLLELAIDVNAAAGRAEGRIGEMQRALVIDLPARAASVGGDRFALQEGDAGVAGPDLYLRASMLARLLPLEIAVSGDDLRIMLTPTEPLPLQQRASRDQRRTLIGQPQSPVAESYELATPYRWLGFPAFETSIELGRDNGRNGFTRRLDARIAADLLKTTFTGYIGTDDNGRAAAANMRFERREAGGGLLGPIDAHYVAAGDVYTPTLSIGPRSAGGMGAVLSTAALGDGDVFERITLRGELLLGYDVELYVNDVLRGSQNQANRGRYEFLDVPLVRGVNVIRIVTYGPRGERQEQSRVINVGGGLLAPGELAVEAGLVLQEQPVLELQPADDATGAAKGKPRAVVNASVGLAQTLTGIFGLAAFPDQGGLAHRLVTAGLRGSLGGIAVQADTAHDLGKGSALALGGAGRLGAVSYVARHVEYRGEFEDETNFLNDPARRLARHSELQLDTLLPFFLRGGLPVSLKGRRAQFGDGGATWQGQVRTTLAVLDTLFALASDYEYRATPGGRTSTWNGNLAASRRIGDRWQLRASLDFEVLPKASIRTLSLTADRALSERFGLRGGAAKDFGSVKELTLFAGGNARLPFADAALSADYSVKRSDWRIALQLSAGLVFDPFSRGYRMTRPGPASGASAALLAFVDDNGNGKADAGERRVPGISVMASGTPVPTDSEGRAFATGLGSGSRNQLQIDNRAFDEIFATSPPQNVSFAARPGQVLPVLYPFTPSSEVIITLRTPQSNGELVGLSAVRFALVEEGGRRLEMSTQFDGRAILENVPPGRYKIVLEEDQARRLGMDLDASIEFEVTTQGRAIRREGVVKFVRGRE